MPRVLLVDDEKNVLKTLSIGLRRQDYSVEEAQTGTDALKYLEKHTVDVVVSDIRMTPMDGYTLASEIQKQHPQIPVILMSAYGFENQQVEEKDGIIYPKITKPFSVNQLIEKLKEVETSWNPNPNFRNKLLVFSDPDTMHKIEDHLNPVGIMVFGTDSAKKFLGYLDKLNFDCILIDENLLQNAQWKILNDVDARAPDKPVLLLVESTGQSTQHTVEDLRVSLLDRKTFFQDRSWLEKCF